MTQPPTTIPSSQLPPGTVRRAGPWTVGNRDGELFAVSRRCRHQLADLSQGSLDSDGCLVCPWHQSSYDVRSGEMQRGPRGFLWYHGETPRYAGLVLAYARHLRLQVRRIVRHDDTVVID